MCIPFDDDDIEINDHLKMPSPEERLEAMLKRRGLSEMPDAKPKQKCPRCGLDDCCICL